MMRFRSKRRNQHCPLCREPVHTLQRHIRCRGCGTRYHRGCAVEMGGCATLGCSYRGQTVDEEAPAGEAVPLSREKPSLLRLAVDQIEIPSVVMGAVVGGLLTWALWEDVSSYALRLLIFVLLTFLYAVVSGAVGDPVVGMLTRQQERGHRYGWWLG